MPYSIDATVLSSHICRLISAVIVLALTLTSLAGCETTATGPYQPTSESARDTDRARHLTEQAIKCMDRDLAKAERLLRDALTADLYYGPAHNNLGVVFLNQGKLYEAANEFEWARKLMPGHPDPRMNLALTLEQAGRYENALATYETALEVYPEHMPTIQAITRLQLRTRRTDDRTNQFLREIAMRGENGEWREWAKTRLALRSGG